MALFLAFLLSQSLAAEPIAPERAAEFLNAMKATADAATKDGWTVLCTTDAFDGTRECWAGTFVDRVPFNVSYIGGLGPQLSVGLGTYGAIPVKVQIDGGPVHAFENRAVGPNTLINELKAGRRATFTYFTGPQTERRMEVDLTHFSDAMRRLDAIR